jgi:hypothetical protein
MEGLEADEVPHEMTSVNSSQGTMTPGCPDIGLPAMSAQLELVICPLELITSIRWTLPGHPVKVSR